MLLLALTLGVCANNIRVVFRHSVPQPSSHPHEPHPSSHPHEPQPSSHRHDSHPSPSSPAHDPDEPTDAELNKLIASLFASTPPPPPPPSGVDFDSMLRLFPPPTVHAQEDPITKELNKLFDSLDVPHVTHKAHLNNDHAHAKSLSRSSAADPLACSGDEARLCPPAAHSMHCLAEHSDELSTACHNAVHHSVPFVCKASIQAFKCNGLEEGVLHCLARQKNGLHGACLDALKAVAGLALEAKKSGSADLVDAAGNVLATVFRMTPLGTAMNRGSLIPLPSVTNIMLIGILGGVIVLYRNQQLRLSACPTSKQAVEIGFKNDYGAI